VPPSLCHQTVAWLGKMQPHLASAFAGRDVSALKCCIVSALIFASTTLELEARSDGPHAALATAMRHAKLGDVDPNEGMCLRERTVERWLRDLTGLSASAFHWSGGRCQLQRASAGDAGGRWCGQAVIDLARPLGVKDRPTIEVYFEQPRRGRPSKAYAFRGQMLLDGSLDYTRFPADFEASWSARFPARTSAVAQGRCPREADR
jgi:hypothetical protein